MLQNTSDIPDSIRQREDAQTFTDEQWDRFVAVYNDVCASGEADSDRASEIAIDRAKTVEMDKHLEDGWLPTWVAAITTGPLHIGDRIVHVTEDTLQAVASEYHRHQQDLAEAGLSRDVPVTYPKEGPHKDSGRKDGDITDVVAGRETLYTAVDWVRGAEADIKAGRLDRVSVNVRARHRDSRLGETYAPYLKELSSTLHPRDPDAGIAASFEDFAASEWESAGFEVKVSDDNPPDDLDETTADDWTVFDLTAAEQDDMKFSKWLDAQLDRYSTPEGGPAGSMTREQLAGAIAEGSDASAEQIQNVAKGKVLLPSDAVVEAVASAFEMDAQTLRAGDFKIPGGNDEPDEGGEGGPAKPSPPDGGQTPEGGEQPPGMSASEGDEVPAWAQGLKSSVDELREENEQIREQNSELKESIELAERMAKANTSPTSSPGEGFGASGGDGFTGDENGPLDANTYEEGIDALEAAEEEMGAALNPSEQVVYANFKSPHNSRDSLPESIKSKIRDHEE